MYQKQYPFITNILNQKPSLWINSKLTKVNQFSSLALGKEDMVKAEKLWDRFVPFFKKEFPETEKTNGIIESPLKEINGMNKELLKRVGMLNVENVFLKCDNELPIAGSIKARGGIYEVLYHAENLAKEAGLINSNTVSYEVFSNKEFKELFKQYSIGVGSTGNLGLSIGIMSAKLGFDISVYMSRDAKQWKKSLLRDKGAKVFEFEGDFSQAVDNGRQKTLENSNGYFVDDESSKHLFLGYSTVAFRLKKQLKEKDITVDQDHPLFVYLPCGVGGAPGGITFGLKQVFGDAVHCFFVEPVKSPSLLLGLITGEKDKISIQDFGIDNRTEADGLAVGRTSEFASSYSEKLVSGIYTLKDEALFELLTLLADTEGIYLEPSATAGIIGPYKITETDYISRNNIDSKSVTHIAWATGGGLVPKDEMEYFYQKGKDYLGNK